MNLLNRAGPAKLDLRPVILDRMLISSLQLVSVETFSLAFDIEDKYYSHHWLKYKGRAK